MELESTSERVQRNDHKNDPRIRKRMNEQSKKLL